MKPYLVLGDTHNDLDFVRQAILRAKEHGAVILQCGDWGFLWPGNDRLAELAAMLIEHAVVMRFADGNHDDHPRLRKYVTDPSCGVVITPNLIYQPRGSVHEDEDGARFLFLGGAPSIDRASRIKGRSWWPEETITEEEFQRAMAVKGPIRMLVTHDAPDYPPGFSPKGSPAYQREQVRSMKYIDTLIRRHRPSLHVHGHWHTNYERRHVTGTLTVGLNCNTYDPAYLDEATLLWPDPSVARSR